MISNALKILMIGVQILVITYILGMFWWILCTSIEDFYYGISYTTMEDERLNEYQDNFIVYYGMHSQQEIQNMVALIYFAFTTLSTVGFGDYVPRGDAERVIGAFILLMGVAIFSFVMGIFSELL